MTSRGTYDAQVLVLRKTKLGESDLILTCLSADGSQLRLVAKGARKPKSPFASRLDLFESADVLAARGRSLDVASEARLLSSRLALRTEYERTMAASPVLEALSRTGQEGLAVPRLFDMANAALDAMAGCKIAALPALSGAFLLKLSAMLGMRPSLDACVSCGSPVDAGGPGAVRFSFAGGGVVCDGCAAPDAVGLDGATVLWCRALLGATFAWIQENEVAPEAGFAVLRFCHEWLRHQMGINLKSLNLLLSGTF